MRIKKYIFLLIAILIFSFLYFLLKNYTPSTDIKVKVFFGNIKKNPQAFDCTLVYGVERNIKKTPDFIKQTVEELLKGPLEEEKKEGYFSSINPNVKINSLVIKDGIAYIDFDPTLEQAVGGSCRVAAIRSQIVTTLKQFPEIKDVVISINGRTEDILQP